jgi:hypothetical protein
MAGDQHTIAVALKPGACPPDLAPGTVSRVIPVASSGAIPGIGLAARN